MRVSTTVTKYRRARQLTSAGVLNRRCRLPSAGVLTMAAIVVSSAPNRMLGRILAAPVDWAFAGPGARNLRRAVRELSWRHQRFDGIGHGISAAAFRRVGMRDAALDADLFRR